jgi:hypothetical protein
MTKGRMAKRRAARRKRNGDSRAVRRRLVVTLQSLEVMAGHDGLFRGKPEPVVVVAGYRAGVSAPALIGKLHTRAKLTGKPPLVASLGDTELCYDARMEPGERFVIVAVAIELDSGDGLAKLHSSLERPASLELWSPADPVPAPISLSDYARRSHRAPEASRIELLVGSEAAAGIARGDDLVSSSAFVLDALAAHDESWRLEFEDPSGQNRWTALVRAHVS